MAPKSGKKEAIAKAVAKESAAKVSAAKESNAKKPAAAEPKKVEAAAPSKKKAKQADGNSKEEPQAAFLSSIRPARRSVFFFLFVLFCVTIVVFYSPCDIKGKRRDCGYSGISPMECQSAACFLKGGGSIGRQTVKVKRKSGASLGLEVQKGGKAGEGVLIQDVKEGAVKEHNDALPEGSQDVIRAGDVILRLDKESEGIVKGLQKTNMKTVEFELKRNRVPSFLMWLENKDGKPNYAERILTSSGSKHFAASWAFMAKIGAAFWLISGYPLGSLPTYGFLSAAVSFYLSRCCHDSGVPRGEPHCHRSNREPITDVLDQVSKKIKALLEAVQKDPKSYLDWFIKP